MLVWGLEVYASVCKRIPNVTHKKKGFQMFFAALQMSNFCIVRRNGGSQKSSQDLILLLAFLRKETKDTSLFNSRVLHVPTRAYKIQDAVLVAIAVIDAVLQNCPKAVAQQIMVVKEGLNEFLSLKTFLMH